MKNTQIKYLGFLTLCAFLLISAVSYCQNDNFNIAPEPEPDKTVTVVSCLVTALIGIIIRYFEKRKIKKK